ncbi:arylamine N-acetyltransferase [Bacillus sp. FJAT-47783]|uniref:arylamine N-acetyltransferase family protein n=1 Tax=Bacillus sp. FJAT-47783 TaxID=2922712 RepID=UPI001FAC972A|nr:arylamine N-acetyltransferase [Bacillus sp. FJAT-47783]
MTSELNTLFRKRIGISENEKITFETLDQILEKTAYSIPFENLSIMTNNTTEVTKENLINKMLVKNEGGLCYELNSLLYFFLIENGFSVVLVRGVVYDHVAQKWPTLGRTHVAILLTYEEQKYLVDTGFGGNLPLTLVPLNGKMVQTANGEFRIKKEDSDHGNYLLEMKLKYKDTDWRIGYAFDSTRPINDVSEFNEIQKTLIEKEQSPFNKHPLITRLTSSGNITLTNSTFTQWKNGHVTKEQIDDKTFRKLAKQHFGIE